MKAKKILSLLLVVAMLVGVLCMGASAADYEPVSISEGEPVKIVWSGTTGTVVSVDGTDYIPQQFILWAQKGFAVSVDGTALSPNSTPREEDRDVAYTVYTDETNAITITAASSTVTYTITCQHYTEAAGGVYPTDANGYLPIGQYSRWNSYGWGNLYSGNTNVKNSSNYAKGTKGYESVGVSLGMAGGYIQYDMGANRIKNNPNNKYGIDFIIYGNAFVGNPEAAGVMVSNDGEKWYTLAGSRHYMDGTKWNQTISYIRLKQARTDLNSAFTAAGIYYSTDYVVPETVTSATVDQNIYKATWQGIPKTLNNSYPRTFTTAAAPSAWWPEWTYEDGATYPENYGAVWNIDDAVNGVSWTRLGAGEIITYSGVTIVEDDEQVLKDSTSTPTQAQMTDVYQWGYADVRVNGSKYGTVVNNPYAAAPSTDAGVGGDGFDLSWAVKADGTPIALSEVRYVRIYSAVLYNAGIFGETSAEVCGLYVASAESSTVGTTAAPTSVSIDNLTIVPETTTGIVDRGNNVYYYHTANGVSESEITVSGVSGANVFINGTAGSSLELSEDATAVQILVQSGNAAPYILVID